MARIETCYPIRKSDHGWTTSGKASAVEREPAHRALVCGEFGAEDTVLGSSQVERDKKIILLLDSLFSLAMFRHFPSSPHLVENVFSLPSPSDCGAH